MGGYRSPRDGQDNAAHRFRQGGACEPRELNHAAIQKRRDTEIPAGGPVEVGCPVQAKLERGLSVVTATAGL